MNINIAQTLSPQQFKRRFGVQRDTFKEMVKVLQPLWRPIPLRGAKPKLTLAEQVLVTLEYLREYRTYFHIGSSWGVSESTICRLVHWVEDHLMNSGHFRIPGKSIFSKGLDAQTLSSWMSQKLRLSGPNIVNVDSILARKIRLWTNLRVKWCERYVRKDNDGSNAKPRHYRHLHYAYPSH
jgi:Helix-turn-helix of DDE superfamily endonuclease